MARPIDPRATIKIRVSVQLYDPERQQYVGIGSRVWQFDGVIDPAKIASEILRASALAAAGEPEL